MTRVAAIVSGWVGGFFTCAAISDLMSGYAGQHIMLAVVFSAVGMGLSPRD